jgi:iron complex outermembrane receptor protein
MIPSVETANRPFMALAKPSLLAVAVLVAASPSMAFELEEVVVTAQKREQNIQDVPLSVTAMNTEKLDELVGGGADLRALAGRAPSLQVESSFGRAFPRIYLRGLGNTDFDLNASQPVSLIFDDVVQENPILKGFPIFDVERLEVLRGPQGTLFGRNSPAGIIKFDSRKPTQEFDAYFKVGYGTFDLVDLEGAVGGALTDTLSARLSVQVLERDDWLDNTGPQDDLEGYNDTAARFQLLYEPNESFSALANVHMRDLDGTARAFRANIIEQGTNDFVSGFDMDKVSTNGDNEQKIETLGGLLKLTYDTGSLIWTSITGYEEIDMTSVGDIDGGIAGVGPGFIPFDSVTRGSIPDHYQFTQEIRVASADTEGFEWQAGLFYFQEDLTVSQISYSDGAGTVPRVNVLQEQETDAWGVFGRVGYDVTESFNLTLGLRYSSDEKDYAARRYEGLVSSGVVQVGPLTTNPDDDYVSWDISGTYFIDEDVSIYARAGRSSRAPSIQGRILFGPAPSLSEAETETNTSFEVGLKSELMDRRLRLNATVFAWKMEDQQVTAVGGTANTSTLLNLDETVGRGIEADIEFAATENLYISAGFSYNDTEINDDETTVQVCGAPCTPYNLNEQGRGILDGSSLPQTAERIANLEVKYTQPLKNGNSIYFSTDWSYQSDLRFTLYESESFRRDSILLGGARFGYVMQDGKYEVAAYGRNITNEEYLTGAIDFNNLTGFVNEPRVWGVEFIANFGD